MWSLASFYATSGVIGHVTIHDDGTLQKEDIETIHRLFPSARIARTIDFLEQHGQMLAEYQSLLDFRRLYKRFQSKKLIDVYFERKGDIILYLDSDLLWFNASPEITEFVEKEMEGESFMMSNGVERVHVTFRDGSRTTDEVAECNSGVTLFNAKDYSLERLTEYINKCDYLGMKFTDQACFGTVLKNVHILPRDRYFIKGKIVEDTIMRHYTGPSREKFFFYGINFLASKILDTDTK
jgi:lipopolysaccharide biosynthesis glycosyltransferase